MSDYGLRLYVDSAVRADSKETGAVWQANAALEQAAYGTSADARQSAAAVLKLSQASQGVEVEAALASEKLRLLVRHIRARDFDTFVQLAIRDHNCHPGGVL